MWGHGTSVDPFFVVNMASDDGTSLLTSSLGPRYEAPTAAPSSESLDISTSQTEAKDTTIDEYVGLDWNHCSHACSMVCSISDDRLDFL